MALCSLNHFSKKVSSLKDIEICAVVYRSLAVIRVSTSHTDTKTQQPLHCLEYLQGRTLGRNSFTGLGTVTVIHTTLPINLSGSCLHGYFTFSSLFGFSGISFPTALGFRGLSNSFSAPTTAPSFAIPPLGASATPNPISPLDP